MALIKWKQISGLLGNYGNLTGSLDISGSLKLNGAPIGDGNFKEATFNSYTQSLSNGTQLVASASYAISASHEILTEISSSHSVQADSSSFISDLFISASAVRAGFGANINVFTQTGSYFSTTNTLHITGGLALNAISAGDVLSIFSGSTKTVSINQQGVIQLASQSVTPTAVKGGIYLDGNYDLYIGQE